MFQHELRACEFRNKIATKWFLGVKNAISNLREKKIQRITREFRAKML